MLGIIPSEFGKNISIWVGTVESRNDPMQRGRVRVRIFGRHTQDQSLIPTESLPWAMVVQSVTSAAIGGVGQSPTGIMEGSMVLGFFMDGNDMQMPCVLGTIGPIEGVTTANGGSGDGTVNADGIQDSNYNLPGNVVFSDEEPKWLSIARAEIGVKEFVGASSNPRIMEYHKVAGLSGTDDVPWCSSFVAWCLKNAGIAIDGAGASSSSWTQASSMEKLDTPVRGCIVVFRRAPNPNGGHVGFLDSIQGGKMQVIHGNASDSVKLGGCGMPIVGFYWPKGQPKEPYQVKTS